MHVHFLLALASFWHVSFLPAAKFRASSGRNDDAHDVFFGVAHLLLFSLVALRSGLGFLAALSSAFRMPMTIRSAW